MTLTMRLMKLKFLIVTMFTTWEVVYVVPLLIVEVIRGLDVHPDRSFKVVLLLLFVVVRGVDALSDESFKSLSEVLMNELCEPTESNEPDLF